MSLIVSCIFANEPPRMEGDIIMLILFFLIELMRKPFIPINLILMKKKENIKKVEKCLEIHGNV